MIQLVINTNMLRELDEDKLISYYGRFLYNDEKDITDDGIIKENLKHILDWDILGDGGLGIYCSKFEDIKRKDWDRLISFIKENSVKIIEKSNEYPNKKRKEEILKESIKEVYEAQEAREMHNIKRFTDENYQVSGRGKKARPCIYEGREYKSRQECMYKEGLTKYQLWIYLKETNQI